MTVAYYETPLDAQAGDPADALASPTPTSCPSPRWSTQGSPGTPPGSTPASPWSAGAGGRAAAAAAQPAGPPTDLLGTSWSATMTGTGPRLRPHTERYRGHRRQRQLRGDFQVTYHLPGRRRPGRGHRAGRQLPQHGQAIWARVENTPTGCARITPSSSSWTHCRCWRRGPRAPGVPTGRAGRVPVATFDPTVAGDEISQGDDLLGLLRDPRRPGQRDRHRRPHRIPEHRQPAGRLRERVHPAGCARTPWSPSGRGGAHPRSPHRSRPVTSGPGRSTTATG